MIKPLEIFCGTGGVGKTTLATSRALYLASQGHRVLLITIDPSKRLKEVLNLSEDQAGSVEEVSSKLFFEDKDFKFWASLMSPEKTLDRLAAQFGQSIDSKILKILARPYGGLNEVLSLVEVQNRLQSKEYDCIVLDTPPGGHFIDFLDSCKRINQFFDKSFMDIFKSMADRFEESKEKKTSRLLSSIVSSGIGKLMQLLEKLTGKAFIEEFVKAIQGIYLLKDGFLNALSFEEKVKFKSYTNWFLVTAVDHNKILEAQSMQGQAKNFMHEDSFILVNRSYSQLITPTADLDNDEVKKLTMEMLEKEQVLKQALTSGKQKMISFPESSEANPKDQMKELSPCWEELQRFS